MATVLFELITPESVLFSGEVQAVMLPATEGGIMVMPGHEAMMVILNPGIIAVTDIQGQGAPRGGFRHQPLGAGENGSFISREGRPSRNGVKP